MLDLETEFQKEREDYLDSIRKINQQVAWLQGIVDKMHPLVRRDCNYWNLDQVREESLWDEDNEIWIMPKLTTEKVHLPQAGMIKLRCLIIDFVIVSLVIVAVIIELL